MVKKETQAKTVSRAVEEIENQPVYDVLQQYNFEQMMKQLSLRHRWIVALLVMVLGGTTFSTWNWFRQRNRQIKAQHKIDTLQEMNRMLESAIYQKQQDIRNSLLWRFKLSWGIIELNGVIKKPGKSKHDNSRLIRQINKIVYGRMEIDKMWDALIGTFEEVKPGLAAKVREKYPDLTKNEFRISLLVYAGFSINESAMILDLSPNTIQTRRSGIRRKMGLGNYGDIAAHIDQLS